MKITKMLTVLVVALGFLVCSAQFAGAVPIGTAFTYQGHLYDANHVANNLYDFQFKLFDDPDVIFGNQVGSDVNVPDVDVIDSYFTVVLDFNDANAFNGDERWLEIGVRRGELEDPNGYTILSPRQEVTPTPYALYAKKGGSDNDWQTSGDDMYSIPSGNVGIGTSSPLSRLSAGGNGFVNTGVYGNGSDYGVYGNSSTYGVFGRGSYSGVHGRDNDSGSFGRLGHNIYGVYGSGTVYGGYFLGEGYFSGNVGIGTTSPEAKLGIAGDVKATGSFDSPNAVIMASNTDNGYGVQGESLGTSGRGVYGRAYGSNGMGVYGFAAGTGVATNYGGYFMAAGDHGKGIYGINTSSVNYGYIGGEDYAVYGEHKNGTNGYLGGVSYGVYGYANSGEGVHGYSNSGRGVYGSSSVGIGIYGSSNWYAGWFDGTIRVEGDIQYTGNLSYQSDIRLKENITLLRGAIEKVSCLKGVYFNFKGESSDNREVGVIAQDVEKVLPELVSTNEQGYKSVDYTKLTPVLIEAVKELKAENELLKQRLETQEKTLQQIQTVITKGTVQ